MCVNVSKIKNILFAPISDHVVPHVHVLCPLGGHVVGAHTYARFIVFMEENWLMNVNTEFGKERTQPDYCVAGIGNRAIFGSGR